MTYLKLTPEQREIKRWRARRDALVGKMLAADLNLARIDALRIANRQMGRMPGRRK